MWSPGFEPGYDFKDHRGIHYAMEAIGLTR